MNPHHREILESLRDTEWKSVREVAAIVLRVPATVGETLAKMKREGLVARVKDGKGYFWGITHHGLLEIRSYEDGLSARDG